jgi:IS5 family transposase
MIKLRHQQPSLWHSGLAADIEDLWEPWMRLVDGVLEDEQLLDTIYEAQGERYPQSRKRGREQTPAEVLLRLLLLKPIRNWSYDTLEREVRANLVYRAFTRVGDGKVPDARTIARLGQLIGPEVIEELHQRIVQLAQEPGVTRGRKLRVDTTVVETNIHYPTDSASCREFTPGVSTAARTLSGCPAFDLKPGKLIILQHCKHVGEFFQARCKFISPLVSEKHR